MRVAVLALDGRGGGEVVVMGWSLRKGSRSTALEGLRCGGGFWRELRTREGVPVAFLGGPGGGGAVREGTKASE